MSVIFFVYVSRTKTVTQNFSARVGLGQSDSAVEKETSLHDGFEMRSKKMSKEMVSPAKTQLEESEDDHIIDDEILGKSILSSGDTSTSPVEIETKVISANLRVYYPPETFVGKGDYHLRIQIDPRLFGKNLSDTTGLNEITDTLEFVVTESTPALDIAVHSSAFQFNQESKRIQILPNQMQEVIFFFHPLEKMSGNRILEVSISYQGILVKELVLKVDIKDFVIDGLEYHHVRRIKILSTLLSGVSGIISTVMQILGL